MKTLLLAALLLGASASAQDCTYTGIEDPQLGSTSGSYGAWFMPWLSAPNNSFRVQFLVDEPWFQGVPTWVRDIAGATRLGWRRVRYGSLQVRMGQTSVVSLMPGTPFTASIGGPMQLVLDVTDHEVTFGPGATWNALGLQNAYRFLPGQGNLLIDIQVQGVEVLAESSPAFTGFCVGGSTSYIWGSSASGVPTTSTTGSGVFAGIASIRLCTDLAAFTTAGAGCSGGGHPAPVLGVSGLPQLGGASTFWLSNALPNGLGLLVFGETAAPPFPLDLGLLGANGCRQYFAITSSVGIVIDGAGIGSHTVHVPNNSALVGAIVFGQYASLAPGANSLGLLTSNYGRVQVGL